MDRSSIYTGIVLRSRSSKFSPVNQESNRDVWFLTAEAGVMQATVFGGPKSRLRSYASPFHSGKIWIYHQPVKDTRKFTDFDVKEWRPGLRELYERVMAADAIAETVLESHGGGGNWDKALTLTEAALDVMALADSNLCSRLLLHFMWQWADFLGLKPEFDHCYHCGKKVSAGNILWYLHDEGAMICVNCFNFEKKLKLLEISPGCRNWLDTVIHLPPAQLNRYNLDKKSFNEAKVLATAILTEALGKQLLSWEW